jgi:hypothetical protein
LIEQLVTDRAFRGRIKEVRTDVGRAVVSLVDFGGEADVELASVRDIPQQVAQIELQAREIKLACVAARVNDQVWEMVRGKAPWAHLMHTDGETAAVPLTNNRNGNAASIDLELIRRNMASFQRHELPPTFDTVVAGLDSARPSA